MKESELQALETKLHFNIAMVKALSLQPETNLIAETWNVSDRLCEVMDVLRANEPYVTGDQLKRVHQLRFEMKRTLAQVRLVAAIDHPNMIGLLCVRVGAYLY